MQNTLFPVKKTLQVNGRLLSFDQPKVMAILNVTPDSFYDGGRYTSDAALLRQADKMIREGADLLDVGGYSSRPGAASVPMDEERRRVQQAIRLLIKTFPDAIVSVDTFRSEVARAGVGEGAVMINDISGGEMDAGMFDTVAALRVPYVLMHMRGTPATMASQTQYNNLVKDLLDYFHQKLAMLVGRGVADLLIDPGFGFAKTREQNFQLLDALNQFHVLGHPVLVGLSRKSMIWKTLDIQPADALNGTSALHTIAVLKGASVLRVHDVKEAREVIRLVGEIKPRGQ